MQATPNNEKWQDLTTPSIPPTRCWGSISVIQYDIHTRCWQSPTEYQMLSCTVWKQAGRKSKSKKIRVCLALWWSSHSLLPLLRMICVCLANICMSRACRKGRVKSSLLMNVFCHWPLTRGAAKCLITCRQAWTVVSIPVDHHCMEMWLSGQSPGKTWMYHVFLASGIATSWVKWFTHPGDDIYLSAGGLQQDWSSERGSVSSTQTLILVLQALSWLSVKYWITFTALFIAFRLTLT